MKRWSMLVAGFAFVFAVIPADRAEAQVWFGPQLTMWDFDELGVGARVDMGLGDTFGIDDGAFQNLTGSFNANYLLDDSDITTLIFNLNGIVPFDTDAAFTPYAGAGLNYFRSSFEGASASNSGLNLLGGLFFGLGDIPAFTELQYSTTGAGFLSLSAGVLFGG